MNWSAGWTGCISLLRRSEVLDKLKHVPPQFHERVWGVRDLAPWYPHAGKAAGAKLGEAWFTVEPPLPILVKFLFTSENLSVQVHPDGEWGVGKTEMWHILRAEPEARIALGFEQPISPEELRAAALSGEIERLLRWIPVRAGETYFIPAGTVHAIGAGIAICEIQQNSDITYRLYDYGRPRELHLDRGIAASNPDAWRHPGASVAEDLLDGWKRLAACRYFAADAREVSGTLSYQPDKRRFELLIGLEGAGLLNGQAFVAGEVRLIPEGSGTIELRAAERLRLLRTYVPVEYAG
jgi:mannose-6-phosphate isomerase